jgi:hypothetical protein
MDQALIKIIDDIVRKKLGAYGLDHVDVKEGVDHDGEDALFIDAVLKPGSRIVGGKISGAAHGALNEALLKTGERRFPYFNIRHQEKQRPHRTSSKVIRRAS